MDALMNRKLWIGFLMLFTTVHADNGDDIFDAIPSQFEGSYVSGYVGGVGIGSSLNLDGTNGGRVEFVNPGSISVAAQYGYGMKQGIFLQDVFVRVSKTISYPELKYIGATSDDIALDHGFGVAVGAGYGFLPNPAVLVEGQVYVGGTSGEFNLNNYSLDVSQLFIGGGFGVVAGVNEAWSVDLFATAELPLGSEESATYPSAVFAGALANGVNRVDINNRVQFGFMLGASYAIMS